MKDEIEGMLSDWRGLHGRVLQGLQHYGELVSDLGRPEEQRRWARAKQRVLAERRDQLAATILRLERILREAR